MFGTILKNKMMEEMHQNAKDSDTKTDDGEDTVYSVGAEDGLLDPSRNICTTERKGLLSTCG